MTSGMTAGKPKLHGGQGPLTAVITLLTSSEESCVRGISYVERSQLTGKDG